MFVAEDTTIAILPGDQEDRRLRLNMVSNSPCGATLRLVEETYCSAVGWFAQGQVELSPSQVNALRAVLGTPQCGGKKQALRGSQAGVRNAGSGSGQVAPQMLLSIHRAG
jgi:hypothetical protein